MSIYSIANICKATWPIHLSGPYLRVLGPHLLYGLLGSHGPTLAGSV